MTQDELNAIRSKYGIRTVKTNSSDLKAQVEAGLAEAKKKEPVKDIGTEIKEEPKKGFMEKVRQFAIGFDKGVGKTAVGSFELAQGLQKVNPINMLAEKISPALKKTNANINESLKKPLETVNKKLELNNGLQKAGGYSEIGAEFLAPALLAKRAINIKNALKLNPEELKKVAGTGLEYLKEKALRKLPTSGGNITTAEYSMPKQIRELTTEFKHILSSNPQKTREKAGKLISEYGNKTAQLFEGNNPAVSLDKLKKTIKNAIKNDNTTVYGADFHEIADKAIKTFMSKVESGTAKGLEDARLAWRMEKKNAKGQLSSANNAIHEVLKKTIKELLPEEKRALYDQYKQKQAKLFDIQDIMDVKKAATIGVNKTKNFLKTGLTGAGLLYAYDSVKKLLK